MSGFGRKIETYQPDQGQGASASTIMGPECSDEKGVLRRAATGSSPSNIFSFPIPPKPVSVFPTPLPPASDRGGTLFAKPRSRAGSLATPSTPMSKRISLAISAGLMVVAFAIDLRADPAPNPTAAAASPASSYELPAT